MYLTYGVVRVRRDYIRGGGAKNLWFNKKHHAGGEIATMEEHVQELEDGQSRAGFLINKKLNNKSNRGNSRVA